MFCIKNVFVGIFMVLLVCHSAFAGRSGNPITLKRIHLTALLGIAGLSDSGAQVVAAPIDLTLNPIGPHLNITFPHQRLTDPAFLVPNELSPQAVQLQLASFQALAASHRPFRGSLSWSVLLCKFKDSANPAKSVNYFNDMFVNRGTGGLDDYWRNISYSGVNLESSVVRGWYTEPYTEAEEQSRTRAQRYQDCIDAAKNSPTNPYTPAPGQLVAVITSPGIDLFGYLGVGSFLPIDVDLGGMAHEVGHGLDLDHSFSDDPNFKDADWSQIGEYDDQWDLMSYANVYTSPTARFGNAPPGLNAYYRDRMGWIPKRRILTFGANGDSTSVEVLAPLDNPSIDGYLQIRVPFDPADPYHYYTVEYRQKEGWDAGIPANIVLIHETRKDPNTGRYLSYLIRHHDGTRDPVVSLNENGVIINVKFIIPQTNQATVYISSTYGDRCIEGYVWRQAIPTDHVCVTPDVRTQTWADNAAAASRVEPNGGPFGPDTCKQGYVWREAYSGDHVCVTPEVRTEAAVDNSQANNRNNPARWVYGPNTCKNGFVWREADDSDYVCVTPDIRSQTWADNAAAASRRNPNGGPYGPDTCLQGYVWREAFPGDHVCVIPQTRSQAAADNAAANSRLAIP